MLGHTEAQGLQPVVDVRFSHRKLEFCRGQRVILVTGILRTKNATWLHLSGRGSVVPPWEDLGGLSGSEQRAHYTQVEPTSKSNSLWTQEAGRKLVTKNSW